MDQRLARESGGCGLGLSIVEFIGKAHGGATGEGRANQEERADRSQAFSAEAMVGAREQGLARGMDDYLAKPVKMESLLEAVRQWQSRATLRITCS